MSYNLYSECFVLRRGERMNRTQLKCAGILISLVFVFSVFPQSAATVEWEEYFDGDWDGWTVTAEYNCDWVITNNALDTDTDAVEGICRMWHESNITVGTWKIDCLVPINGDGIPRILFLANGTDPPGASEDDYQGYGIEVFPPNDAIYLYKQDGDWQFGDQLLASAPVEDAYDTWITYAITRNSTGGINVYINPASSVAEPDISFVDTEFSYSERFVLEVHFGNAMFDNITVSDTIDYTPPEHTPTSPTDTTPTTDDTTPPPQPMDPTLIIAGAGVAGIVIIAGVVFMRRR